MQAPLFVLGQTSNAAWVNGIRDNPAPYAEFVSDHVAFSVPSTWIRKLANPTELMTYWDEAVAFMDYVGGLESLRTGPERINVDVQISVGLLHAGYPIQGPTEASGGLVDYQQLITSGDWGYFHELGHEMQRRPDKAWGWDNPYTFSGDVEVTVNIFANAALERMAPNADTAGWGYSAHADQVMAKAIATVNSTSATTFDAKDPYPFYFQLADGFGWDSYRKVLGGYSQDQDTNRYALPQSEQEEKDQFLIRWSRATGRNMVNYMVNHWGLEVSQAAIDTVNNLGQPDWMPMVAQDDLGVYQGGLPITIDVLANDLTLDASARVVGFSAVSSGTLVHNGGGRFTYTPGVGFVGEATFTYTVANGAAVTDVRTVRLRPPSPRSWWTFDEGSGTVAGDSAGSAKGSVVDGSWAAGQGAAGIQFNGRTTKVVLGTGPSLSGNTDFTLSAWVKTSATTSGVIIQQRNGGFNGEYQFAVNANGTLKFMLYGNWAYQFSFNGTRAVNDGQWHHVAAVRSGTQGLLYVDGQLVGSASGTIRDLDASIGVGIGADIRDNNAYFSGTIDEVQIYDVAISPAEITRLAVPSLVTVAAGQTVSDQVVRSGTTGLTKVGGGTLVLDKANFRSGGTVAEAGEVVIRDKDALGTGRLTVKSGAMLTLDVAANNVNVTALTLEYGGRIDLGYGQITVAAGGYSLQAVLQQLQRSHEAGWPNSVGLTSRMAGRVAGGRLGYVVNGDGSLTFGFAAAGDANLDDVVDILDISTMLASGKFNTSESTSWSEGDYNYDQVFDILDISDFLSTPLFNAGTYFPSQSSPAQPQSVDSSLSAVDSAFLALVAEPNTSGSTPAKKRRFAAM